MLISVSIVCKHGLKMQLGETRVRGLELEAKFAFDAIDRIPSYSYLNSKITRDNDGNEGNRVAYAPKRMASAWLNYRFETDALQRLSRGADVRNSDLEGLNLDVSVLNAASYGYK